VTVAGGVLGDKHIAGLKASHCTIGYFNLGDSRQVRNILNAGSVVIIVYLGGWALVESCRPISDMVYDLGELIDGYVNQTGLTVSARIDRHYFDHESLLPDV
jgi:hypothetical protein